MVTFFCVGAVLAVMGAQISLVIESLPSYQSNIIAKLDAWTPADGSSNVLGRFVDMMSRINAEISGALSAGHTAPGQGTGAPVAVEVVENQSLWRMLQTCCSRSSAPL